MSGEKKFAKDSVEEAVYRVIQRKSVQAEIKKLREEFSIEDGGFLDRKKAREYFSKNWSPDCRLESKLQDLIVTTRGLPLNSSALLISYLIANSLTFIHEYLAGDSEFFLNCEFDEGRVYGGQPTRIEERWKKSGKKYIRVYIAEDVGLPTVQRYLDTHWNFIRSSIFQKKKGQKSIRRSKHTLRDELVDDYYQKTRSELGLKKGETKDIGIWKILRDRHGIHVSPENIRKIVERRKKMRDS